MKHARITAIIFIVFSVAIATILAEDDPAVENLDVPDVNGTDENTTFPNGTDVTGNTTDIPANVTDVGNTTETTGNVTDFTTDATTTFTTSGTENVTSANETTTNATMTTTESEYSTGSTVEGTTAPSVSPEDGGSHAVTVGVIMGIIIAGLVVAIACLAVKLRKASDYTRIS